MENDSKVLKMSLDDIMGDRFGRYSKYIIQDRALPDVRDGLKPVQRRILYAMYKEGNLPSKAYRKSAKTVGNVIGNYHPHGDSSVYEAMVRLSQEWKMRMPLVDMQGNNGSIDNDPAAAMRYTEARLAPIALELLRDIDKDTVEMALNFDDTEYEPTVLPAKYPNLLVNGATGISAGYATDIPPHNLAEVIDATIYRIKHPKCSFDDLHKFIKGPDFPTGAIVEGSKEIANALRKGRGKVIVRSKCAIEEKKNMNQIVVTEIPYEVNKAEMVRKIDEIRFNHEIDGIIEVRDESDRSGMRIVIDLKKDVDAHNTLNYLYKNTDLQKNYSYNMVAIKDKRPELMGIEEIIDGYINHEIEVVTRASQFDLDKANKREHIVEGLIKAVSILDDVVHTIRHSKDKADAKKNIISAYGFSEAQAEAIVMLQLYRLTNTDIVALQNEQKELLSTIARLNDILGSEKVLRKVIIDDLKDIKKKYPTPRLTEIRDDILDTTVDAKAMIIAEDCYVSLTTDGYIKKISQRSYKASTSTPFGKKDEDHLCALFKANTTETILAFTNKGNYCFVPVHKIDEFKWKDLGKHISYLIKVPNEEKFIGAILVKNFQSPQYVVLASRMGQIKRVAISDFEVTRFSKAMRCMNLKDHDSVVSVGLSDGKKGIILASRSGYAAIYSETEVSVLGIRAGGIKGIRLTNDELAFMRVFDPLKVQSLMIFTHPAGIKRLHISDIPAAKRGNKGVLIYKSPKSKRTLLSDGFVTDLNDQLVLYSGKDSFEVLTKDYNYVKLESRPGSIKGFDGEIDYIYDPRQMIVDHVEDETGASVQVDLQVKKEPQLFDTAAIEKPASTPKKAASKTDKKPPETHFETISFDDLFDDDDF